MLAVSCGLVAMILIKLYLNAELKRLKEVYKTVPVIAAAQDMPAGTVVKREFIGKIMQPKMSVNNRNVTPDQVDMIIGRKLQNTIFKNGPILWSDTEEHLGGSFAGMVHESERAVSIPVDITSSVTGLVEPNDHVDILGTFVFPSLKGDPQLDTVTLTILQNVTVLATGK